MRLHYLLHVPFEGPGAISTWAQENNHQETFTRLYKDYDLPTMEDFDFLVIMGGPMGVYDDDQYTWLREEKSFLKNIIQEGKPALGICLGAQLLAEALGARVRKNTFKEIGFFTVSLTPIGWNSPIFSGLPASFEALHWHGDTFDIPEDAYHIASSEACPNQAFIYENRIIGFQFHIESTREGLENLIKNCGDELLEGGDYIQKPEDLIDEGRDFETMNKVLFKFMDSFSEYLREKKIL